MRVLIIAMPAVSRPAGMNFPFIKVHLSVIVATFDMSKRDTLESAKKWLTSALNYNTAQKPLVFLVGTKADLLVGSQSI